MLGIENYTAFLFAGILLNITPGADTIYIVTRSISQGKKAGVYSVLGIITGALIHTILSALGLSAILARSAVAFQTVQYLGAAYLIYLGIKMIFEKNHFFDIDTIEEVNPLTIYKQGIITNALNPKVALFFLSFLPQFINPENTCNSLPFIILGATFTATGTIWCLFLAYSSAFTTKILRGNQKIGLLMQKVSGLVFVGLGINLLIKRS